MTAKDFDVPLDRHALAMGEYELARAREGRKVLLLLFLALSLMVSAVVLKLGLDNRARDLDRKAYLECVAANERIAMARPLSVPEGEVPSGKVSVVATFPFNCGEARQP